MTIQGSPSFLVKDQVTSVQADVGTARTGLTILIDQIDQDEDKFSDVDADDLTKLDDLSVGVERINQLAGVTSTADELNVLDGVTSTSDELSVLADVDASADNINKLDGLSLTSDQYQLVAGNTVNVADASNGFEALADTAYLVDFAEDTITADDLGPVTMFIRTSNQTYTLETTGIPEGSMIIGFSTSGTGTRLNTTNPDGDSVSIRINNTYRMYFIIRRGDGWILEEVE